MSAPSNERPPIEGAFYATPKQAAALAFAWAMANPEAMNIVSEPYRCALTNGAMLESVDRMQTEGRDAETRRLATEYWNATLDALAALYGDRHSNTCAININGRFR